MDKKERKKYFNQGFEKGYTAGLLAVKSGIIEILNEKKLKFAGRKKGGEGTK